MKTFLYAYGLVLVGLDTVTVYGFSIGPAITMTNVTPAHWIALFGICVGFILGSGMIAKAQALKDSQ